MFQLPFQPKTTSITLHAVECCAFKCSEAGRETKQRQIRPQSWHTRYDAPRADSVNYFVSGKGDMEAYDPECLFADPFAGFNGVDRFKQNVSNLGGLMYALPIRHLEKINV